MDTKKVRNIKDVELNRIDQPNDELLGCYYADILEVDCVMLQR